MEWKIIKRDDFYYPAVQSWITDTFNLKPIEAILYAMIINKKYITWTEEWMGKVLRCSSKTIGRILDKFVDMQIVEKRTICPNGERKRNVYVALYADAQRRDSSEVNLYISLGLDKILSDYGEKRFYKKRK